MGSATGLFAFGKWLTSTPDAQQRVVITKQRRLAIASSFSLSPNIFWIVYYYSHRGKVSRRPGIA